MKLPTGATQAIRTAVGLITGGDYELLWRMTCGKHLTAERMARIVGEYGRTLRYPPDDAFAEIPHVFADARDGKSVYYVDFPLWTEESGQSDLEMQLVLIEGEDKIYGVEVTGIRVL